MMPGYILLEGGAEFGGAMASPDRRAIELAGGYDTPIRIVPTAAAPDNNHRRAGNNGVRWFKSLGARDVAFVPLIDSASANDAALAAELCAARLIYLLGGFPHYLGQTLDGSLCWQVAQEAYEAGAVLAGSSAGAMVLCQYYYAPETQSVVTGLGLVPGCCVLPHYNTFGQEWASQLTAALPGVVLVGIDEYTGLINDMERSNGRRWTVYGQGRITTYHDGQQAIYSAGETLAL